MFAQTVPDLTTTAGIITAFVGVLGVIVKLFLAQLDRRDAQVTELANKFDASIRSLAEGFKAELKDQRDEGRRLNDRLFEANRETVEVMGELKSAMQALSARVDHMDTQRKDK